MFTASGGVLASGKAWLCGSCTSDVFRFLRLILSNQPVTADPAAITPPPELPEFPDDMADEPLFHEGERVSPAGRIDPRMPDWAGRGWPTAEPGVVEKVVRWGESQSMGDIADLWVYHIRTVEGFLTGPHTAYQLTKIPSN